MSNLEEVFFLKNFLFFSKKLTVSSFTKINYRIWEGKPVREFCLTFHTNCLFVINFTCLQNEDTLVSFLKERCVPKKEGLFGSYRSAFHLSVVLKN